MQVFRWLSVLAISMAAVIGLSVDAASAASTFFKADGMPVCTVSATSASTALTICTGTLSGNNRVRTLTVHTSSVGIAVFHCQNPDGTVTVGQGQLRIDGTMSSTPIPTGSHPAFTTNPTVLTAPTAVPAQDAGCVTGATPVNPTVTATGITLHIDNGSISGPPCSATDPSGLRGTVSLTC
jgi:hypothetical protein